MKKSILIAICLLIFVAGYGFLKAAPSSTMSIKRIDDPVKVKGSSLSSMNGVLISKLRLHNFKNGSFQPMPYQIDQRNANGEWVFTIGQEKEASPTGGKLAANDELAFMVQDLGDAAPKGSKPTGAGACYGISVSDPVDGGAGYAYLCSFDNPPAPSKTDYVSYSVDSAWMWMIGQTYKIGTGVEDSYFSKIHMRPPGGKWGPNVLDRYKSRGSGVPGMGTTPESNAKARAVAWIDGPVRVIRKSKGWLKVAGGLIKIHSEGSSQNIYYPTYFEIPLRVQIPNVPKSLLKDFKLSVTLDFNHLFYGTKYYDPVNRQGVVLDGVMSDAEKNLDRKTSHRWWLVTGPHGSVMSRYMLPANMEKLVPTPAYYMDDKNVPDPPEEEPGQSNVGLILENFGNLPPAEYRYSSFFYFPSNFKWGDQDHLLNIHDKPLQVKVEAF